MTQDNPKLFRLVTIVLSIAVLLCAFSMVKAVINLMGSGTLSVTTPNDDSIITISRENASAKLIGTGQASVHLAPGTYLVGVARQGRFSAKVAHVTKGETAGISLSATETPLLPSSANIDFSGSDELQDKGLTPEQVHALREAIFAFRHNAKHAVISPNSITSPPRDPNTAIGFSKNFTLVIDGTSYKATVSWLNTDTVTLVLTDQSGATVFNSGAAHD